MPRQPTRSARPRARPRTRRRSRWPRVLLYAGLLVSVVVGATFGSTYATYSRVIDERLRGAPGGAPPRVYARAYELRRGQSLSVAELVTSLNELGYAQRTEAAQPGQFTVERATVSLVPRSGELAGRVVRVAFPATPDVRQASGAAAGPRGIRQIEVTGQGAVAAVRLDPPLLTSLASGAREKRRHVALDVIPPHMRQAVLAIEDRSFYSHPGVNPARVVAAAVRNAVDRSGPPVGSSTITQQLARMFFLRDEFHAELAAGKRSYWRKLREVMMALVLERRASKDQILELYLNDVYLGQRGSFAIHGVAQAARLFFGKDVANVSLAEAALVAGVIQSPATRSPFAHPDRAVERRNLVLRAMAEEGSITADEQARAAAAPLQVAAGAVDSEAPYFVDLVGQQLAGAVPSLQAHAGDAHVYTTLDLSMQRAAVDAIRTGLARVDERLQARGRTPAADAQAALVAVDPRTGEILALVGGRSYTRSQFNRAVAARRQPGSVFKPFVFLAAFEHAAATGRTDLTPASRTLDEPASFLVDGKPWEPRNYDVYDGDITWRRALAMSRNLGTIRIGDTIGFDRIAELWRRVGVGTPPHGYPSIALGVFELTPLEVAQAFTLFANGGVVQPLRAIDRVTTGEDEITPAATRPHRVAGPAPTFLVTHMMRAVLDEGTGSGARAAGFTRDAAGKTGTTNDLRDAWFVGFTPDLLAVVWVGLDDNQPLSLTGAQAALPIWTEFMTRALAGRPARPFPVPGGVTLADIDRHSGHLAGPWCVDTLTEAFLTGTEPQVFCELH